MDPMLEAFLSESRDNLETASKCFLELENSPDDKGVMDELFRAVHTIKGSSGLFDIVPFTQVVHIAEDILDNARDGSIVLDSSHIDIFLDAFDQVNAWLDNLEQAQVLPTDAKDISVKLIAVLNTIMPVADSNSIYDAVASTEAGEAQNKLSEKASFDSAPDWLAHAPENYKKQAFELIDSSDGEQQLFAIRYQPDAGCFFAGDDPLHFVNEVPGLVWFSAAEVKPWGELIELDPFSANLAFHIITVCNEETLLNHLRYIPEQVSILTLCPSDLGHKDETPSNQKDIDQTDTNSPYENSSELHSDKLDMLISVLEAQIDMLSTPSVMEIEDRIGSVKRILNQSLPSTLKLIISNENDFSEKLDELDSKQLIEAIQRILATAKNAEQDKGSAALPDNTPEQSTPSAIDDAPINSAIAGTTTTTNTDALEPITTKDEKSSANKVLRVDQQRIDAIMDLVGELVVAKNALPYLAKRAEEEFGVRPLAKEIKSQYAAINRLSDELQSAVMQIRMVPMSTVFQRFPRLVRDLARKLDKKIKLVLEGEDTEADKNVVEELADPLIHLIRNSLDHGLEMPEDRVAAGKSEQGTITLKAIPKDDQVIIEVSDDGKGIDPDIIKRKAYEKGVIDEEKLESISDHEALQLIFAAGFSTAEQVSDLSGRGVGMDVVRTVIQQSGGSVVALSEVGKGSTMRLTLPLSMAVTRVMMLEVGKQLYGISMDNIVETVRVPLADVQGIKQQKAIVLRDRLIPLFDLRNLLEVEKAKETDELAVLVMHHGDDEIGLIIDEFHEGIDIIQKPLEGVMAGFSFYSGTALLGDGKVLLVLNIPELIACQ